MIRGTIRTGRWRAAVAVVAAYALVLQIFTLGLVGAGHAAAHPGGVDHVYCLTPDDDAPASPQAPGHGGGCCLMGCAGSGPPAPPILASTILVPSWSHHRGASFPRDLPPGKARDAGPPLGARAPPAV